MNQSDPLFDDVRLIQSLFPGKPIDITEFNRLDPSTFLTCLSQLEVSSGDLFILGGTPDQAQYDILRLPDLYASFKNWRQPVPTPTPVPVPAPNPSFVVGLGVAAKAAQVGDPPAMDERYLSDWISFTGAARGIYIYLRDANRTYYLRDIS